jgi:hypothetical protein
MRLAYAGVHGAERVGQDPDREQRLLVQQPPYAGVGRGADPVPLQLLEATKLALGRVQRVAVLVGPALLAQVQRPIRQPRKRQPQQPFAIADPAKQRRPRQPELRGHAVQLHPLAVRDLLRRMTNDPLSRNHHHARSLVSEATPPGDHHQRHRLIRPAPT